MSVPTTTALKPITLYGRGGPNPPKVAIILEELGVPYTVDPIPYADVKSPAYTAINPNGRLPSIHDPNTNLTLWESGAIITYLLTHYDPTHKISFPPSTPSSHHATQWLFFQTSGQGPYYGQAAWFKKFHPEQLPSAIERYAKEVNRVTGVLEGHLTQQKAEYAGSESDGPWLVGNKFSYADVVFLPWQTIITFLLAKEEYDVDQYPEVKAWTGKMAARESVKKVPFVGG